MLCTPTVGRTLHLDGFQLLLQAQVAGDLEATSPDGHTRSHLSKARSGLVDGDAELAVCIVFCEHAGQAEPRDPAAAAIVSENTQVGEARTQSRCELGVPAS